MLVIADGTFLRGPVLRLPHLQLIAGVDRIFEAARHESRRRSLAQAPVPELIGLLKVPKNEGACSVSYNGAHGWH